MSRILRNFLLLLFILAAVTAGSSADAAPEKILIMPNIGYVKLPGDINLTPLKSTTGPAWDLAGQDQDKGKAVSRTARLTASEYPPASLGVDKSLFTTTARPQSGQAAQVGDAVKRYMTRYLAQNGGKLLNFYPTETAPIGNRRAWAFSMRADLGYEGASSVFIKTYMLVTDTRVTEVMLVCPDSDRRYWGPMLSRAMATSGGR